MEGGGVGGGVGGRGLWTSVFRGDCWDWEIGADFFQEREGWCEF